MATHNNAFLWAGIGGLLPTVANISSSYLARSDQPLPHWSILVPLLGFAFVGVVLNRALNHEHDIKQAIMIGICAPGILTNIVAGATSHAGHER